MNTKIQAQPQVQTQESGQVQEQEVKRTYKDSVFVTIFHEKAKLIELYNALFDTNYDESAPIDIVTIKDVLFRTLKNDVAFVLGGRFVVLVEHQSSINENMPLRDLMYISTVLKRMIDTTRLYRETPDDTMSLLRGTLQRHERFSHLSGTPPFGFLSRGEAKRRRGCFTTHR